MTTNKQTRDAMVNENKKAIENAKLKTLVWKTQFLLYLWDNRRGFKMKLPQEAKVKVFHKKSRGLNNKNLSKLRANEVNL